MPFLFFALLFLAGSLPVPAAEQRFVFEQAQMGVPFRITLYAKTEAQAQRAAAAAFDHVSTLNSILSDYEAETELSRLSRTSGSGEAVPVSTILWRVLKRSQQYAQETDGAFDITIGPLVNLWRRSRRKHELPGVALLAEMRARTGWRNLELDARTRTAKLLKPEMRLDVGGIAKGFAADEALKVLQKQGCPRALVAASGDIVAGDPPPNEAGWRVQISSLEVPGAPAPETLLLAHAAVSSSGDAYQYVEIEGVRYSHILDPKTGVGLTDRSLVTVVAPDGLTADGMDTTIDVLGPEKGLQWARKYPAVAVRIQRAPDGTTAEFQTDNWRSLPR